MYASLTQFRFLTFTALRILIIATRRNRNRITKTTLLKFGRVTAPSNKYCASYL